MREVILLSRENRLEQIKERLCSATPGPWRWFLNKNQNDVYLGTNHSGRYRVMSFASWGLVGGNTTFP